MDWATRRYAEDAPTGSSFEQWSKRRLAECRDAVEAILREEHCA